MVKRDKKTGRFVVGKPTKKKTKKKGIRHEIRKGTKEAKTFMRQLRAERKEARKYKDIK